MKNVLDRVSKKSLLAKGEILFPFAEEGRGTVT
jgi:hypothetical protein